MDFRRPLGQQQAMDFDSFKTPRDDTVRDGAAFDAYLRPGDLIDSSHPAIVAHAARVAGTGSAREKALRLYYSVRDGLRYDPYSTPMKREAYRASTTLAAAHGYCVNKAGLMAALCRASGIPARVGYADVRNHMTTRRLAELMGSDVFYYHGYTDVWLDGRWLKATPAFNRELTERFGLKPLDWDAASDSIYHPFDLSGRRHMEYLAYRGVFADIPFDEIRAAFRHYYPRMTRQQEELPVGGTLGGDFGAEGAEEASRS
jgi:transglutaminase-like putative cysteine protease